MDSLINHYTANKKVRNDDAYSPGGRIGLRPDRATLPYCHRAREAFPGVPIIAGGVEASLRRLAHYDYWSDTVRRSILLDSKADLLVYGMGEQTIVEIARRLAAGRRSRICATCAAWRMCWERRKRNPRAESVAPSAAERSGAYASAEMRILLPSFEQVKPTSSPSSRQRADPHQHQPLQRPNAGAIPRASGRRRQSAGAAAVRGGDGSRLRPALHAPAASRRTPSRSPLTR